MVQPMSGARFEQLAEHQMKAPFEPLATIVWPLREFAARGVRFTRDHDNLDEVEWALIRIGRFQVILRHHLHSPSADTEVMRSSQSDAQKVLDAVVGTFDIPPQHVSWLADGLTRPQGARLDLGGSKGAGP
jgi:hypothetical protein